MPLLTEPIEMEPFPFAGESRAALEAFAAWKDRVLDRAVDHPLESLVTLVSGGALVFYLAEKGNNESVNTYYDALHYISTCLCVGYANIYPVTDLGKFVAAVVMMLGPSNAAWVLEGRLVARSAQSAGTEDGGRSAPASGESALLEKLDAILQELRALRPAS